MAARRGADSLFDAAANIINQIPLKDYPPCLSSQAITVPTSQRLIDSRCNAMVINKTQAMGIG